MNVHKFIPEFSRKVVGRIFPTPQALSMNVHKFIPEFSRKVVDRMSPTPQALFEARSGVI